MARRTRRSLQKLFALLLVASMTMGMLTAGAFAEQQDDPGTVELSSVTVPGPISVDYGTGLEDVLAQLPSTLTGTVKEAEDPAEGEQPVEGEDPAEGEQLTEGEQPEGSIENMQAPDQALGTASSLAASAVLATAAAFAPAPASAAGPESEDQVPVTWSCDSYDGWTAGAYTFTATLGEGYTYTGALSVTVTVAAQADVVAKIGDTTYATLDDAVEQAEEGATIELLANCKLNKGFNKTLTFTGDYKIRIDKQLTSNGEGWMCFGLDAPDRVLTFDGVEVEWYSEVGTAPWLMLSLSGTLNVTNGAKLMFSVDSGATGSRNAIYMNEGAVINVSNGSTFIINGYDTAGKAGQGIQLDKTGKSSINVTGNSTFLIDGTNRGYVNSPSIYVEDSTFTVQNCTSNASNGGNFTAIDSVVTYQNNAGHGISANNVIIEKSVVTCDNNGYYGLRSAGKFTVDSKSKVYVTNNSYGGDFAGLKLTSSVSAGLVEAGAEVVITGNKCSGLSNNGVCTFEEGAKLIIMNNVNDKGTSSNGGGIYNSGASANLILPADAAIYNNHADTAGDDIYSTGTITFGRVGADWALDGAPDCEDDIDGWYQDGADNRWSAHSTPLYAVEFDRFERNGLTTVTGALALKAAHGLVPVEPDDPEAPDWEISKSKTATNLDANYESRVTLALPAAGYERTMDVVLVIDDTHAGSVIFEGAVNSLLDELAGKPTLDIKVGVVAFDAVSRDWLSATSNGEYSGLVSIKDEEALAALKTAVSTQLDYSGEGSMKKVGGTNTEWAVDMASEILSTGTGEDKYLIMFSDLYGYIYRGDLTIDGTAYSDVPLSKRLGTWKEGSLSMGTKYDTFADAYAHRNDADNQTVDGFFRDSSWDSYWRTYGEAETVPENTIANVYQVDSHTFSGFEKSMCLTYDLLAEAAGQARIIVVNNSFYTGDSPKAQPMVQEMLDALETGGYIKTYRYQTDSADDALAGDAASGVFSGIREDLIQLVDDGSKVVDVIGYGDDYDFDFVNDISKLTLTVNGQALDKTVLADPSFSDPYITSAYGFGFNESAQPGEAAYDFVLRYYADGQDGESDECFVWDINVAVTKETPVQLTYSVKLADPKTAPGTYGQYDEDGSEKYSGLYTNKSATLYPIDSNGVQGMPENFAKPTVSYTLSGGGGGSSYDYYTVTVNYLDQDSGEKIAQSYVSGSIREGRSYDVTAYDAIAIEGYAYVETTGDPLTGTMNSNKVINVYYTAEETDVEDPDVPGGELPEDPGTEDPATDIEDPDVPMGEVPETGDVSALWAALSALSGTGLAAVSLTGRKKREDEE